MARSRLFVQILLGLTLVAVCGCTHGASRHGHAPPGTRQAAQFPALRGAPSDGGAQYIAGFASAARTTVAVGGNNSAGSWRPIFLRSTDDGRTWATGTTSADKGTTLAAGDTAELVVTRDSHYLAVGHAAGGTSVWSSDDGLRWVRHAAPAFTKDDTVSGLAVTDSGFCAVGTHAANGTPKVPVVWTSADGLHWVRRDARALGLGREGAGGSSMTSVAARGRTVVAVGEVGDEPSNEKPEYPALWRSTDAAATWQRVATTKDVAGTGTRSWFSEVRWLAGRFVAVGTGGDFRSGHYAGVVATSRDGRTWTADWSGPVLSPNAETYLATVSGHGSDIIALGSQRAGDTSPYGVRGTPGHWQRVSIDARRGGGNVAATTTVTTPTGTVLTGGWADPHGDSDARIWRATDARTFRTVGLTALQQTLQPTVRVWDLAYGAHQYRAVGTSSGLPVVWTSTDGSHFASPAVLDRRGKLSADTVTYGPAGWLVTGAEFTGTGYQAMAWASVDGTRWRASPAGTFGRAGPFAYSELNAAVPFRRGWAVVGIRAIEGPNTQAAAAFTSLDGARWRAADPNSGTWKQVGGGRVITQAVGGTGGARTMADVVPVGRSLIAVGATTKAPGAISSYPAAWLSPDGYRWTLSTLPLPAHASTAAIDCVAAEGSVVIGFGTATFGAADRGYVWTSRDGGRSWGPGQALPNADGASADVTPRRVVVSGHGFVALGTSGRPGAQRPAKWVSPDGRTWRAGPLSDARLHQPGDWSLHSSIVVGAKIVGLAERSTVDGVQTLLFAEPS
jgi:hypothetical protein